MKGILSGVRIGREVLVKSIFIRFNYILESVININKYIRWLYAK